MSPADEIAVSFIITLRAGSASVHGFGLHCVLPAHMKASAIKAWSHGGKGVSAHRWPWVAYTMTNIGAPQCSWLQVILQVRLARGLYECF